MFFADNGLAKSFGTSPGWFWWTCQSGCLPEGEPSGPFATSYAAYRDALDGGIGPEPILTFPWVPKV